MAFAAQLIPILHQYLYLEPAQGVAQKVSPWRNGVTKCNPGNGTAREHTSSSTGNNGDSTSAANSRKRQRSLAVPNYHPVGNQEDEEKSEDDGNDGPSEVVGFPPADGVPELPRLACHFHKRNPQKYGIQHESVDNAQKTDYYRACAGPGFKSIQRLK